MGRRRVVVLYDSVVFPGVRLVVLTAVTGVTAVTWVTEARRARGRAGVGVV
jgi:hypothetical protein